MPVQVKRRFNNRKPDQNPLGNRSGSHHQGERNNPEGGSARLPEVQ